MQTSTKKEVSKRGMQGVLDTLIEKKFDMNILLEGIPYDLEYLKNRHERIEWWVYCKIIANLRRYFTQVEFEKMNSSLIARGKYFEAVLFGFFLFGSNRLARTFSKQIWKLGESQFSNIKQKTEFLDKNKIRIYAILKEGYEFPVEFAYFTKGTWDGLATLIGRKKFKVDFTFTKQLVTFDVSWDKEGFLFRIGRVIRWFFNIKRALFEVTDTHAEMLQRYDQLQESKWKLERQTRQLKIAYEIATSIKQTLHINETLNAITNTLSKEADFSAVQIKLFKDIDDNNIQIEVQTGIVNELATPLKREIILNAQYIGEIISYPTQQIDYQDVNELVDYLIPVINIAIYNALVLMALVDYRDNLERKVSERTNELLIAGDRLTETNKLLKQAQIIQSNFFANISHEFRTPLTLILGPAKNIFESTQEAKTKQNVSLIKRNASRLLGLVNQLLDISKLESGNMKLQTSPRNIIPLLKGLVLSFTSYAERKRITLKFKSVENEIIVYVDKDKLEKIITNILSNAFKFTPEGGEVEVTVTSSFSLSAAHSHPELVSGSTTRPKMLKLVQHDNSNFVEISIRDTGIGIPADRIEKIFDRFYQVDGSHTREHEGTGIGLSLTKELVQLHKGKISVESEPGKGSRFTVSLPLGKDHLSPEEICEPDEEKEYEKEISETEEEEESKPEEIRAGLIEKGSLPLLLIVEDNSDVRTYIKENLKTDYRILEAVDGEDGWEKSVGQIPDLIVSDVMMPKMDGFKFCEKLKTDQRTSHIPIILLTAKATKEDKLEGYELGADEYLMKPFDTDELKSRIKNLIGQRKRLHDHFRIKGLIGIEQQKITSIDKKFLQKSFDLIDRHISDSSFSVEMLAEELAISRSGLQKKIQALVGETPGDLIRRIRLKKAAELIKNKFGNLSEIALEVGYNNPVHFSEAFKRQFGTTPSQFQ